MTTSNYWLRKDREPLLIKIVDWAQRNNKLVEELTKEDLIEAIKYKPTS